MSTEGDLARLLLAFDQDERMTIPSVRLLKGSNGWSCTVGDLHDHRALTVIHDDPDDALRDALAAHLEQRRIEKDIASLI